MYINLHLILLHPMRIEDDIKQPIFRDDFQKAHINLLFTASWLQLRQAVAFKP